jgi:hypothetical protein
MANIPNFDHMSPDKQIQALHDWCSSLSTGGSESSERCAVDS